ncbi:PhzF superfamily (YHI9) (PDB:1SDJ) (PUBMED:24914732) [Commensalibacter communis]|uniref:PhzF superfamily (YHI9) n=2 Tax=Commensalibacter communis TaxID=2972786 RepID=A0A9W4X5H3_9PROT|nr:PhzF superfamily (YHI9) (PDB:1SDJ) (PUBMED:24914732) [Commensalibacter communis]CAI3923532.1 PhzF superfamily (YHI9) (PDB:1SDJ) (PUBMED:24914732) [Commensalibacter communis]CAI3931248.1 PhzF superfamily (YHI9) (PDB:1SDJ) (PUBMED:24914732) [Commensalibacter communis]CAI3938953.1 PhzF superfamily (YHI9) (PDB:1SDJ) (PUBMED:24914732) [Commensalibacter communis]CAI3939529.1 PhzF superfamily (YHI9) (PDB:1SDJ) (PUBMED:24914732) [Commensalibacter communis]
MKCYVVDAFSNEIFKGNPAAVCILDQWVSDELMQKIA